MVDASPTILVVEDEALILFALSEDLRAAGFQVLEARNADEAVRKLEENPDIGLMFTDIDMPGSMDGLCLSANVRDRWPPVRIIITSGKRKPGSEAMPDGGVFLSKPYSPEDVAIAIHKMFL